MSENQAAVENVQKGTAVTIAVIPIAIVLYSVVGMVNVIVLFVIAAGFIPTIARGLYTRGAGAPLSRAGWKPFIIITSVALLLGLFAGLVFRTYAAFSAVNPRLGLGGILTPAFWTTFGRNLDGSNSGDLLIQAVIALIVGALAIVGVVRGQLPGRAKGAVQPQLFTTSENVPVMPADAATFPPSAGPLAAAPPAAPPAYGSTPVTPSAHGAPPIAPPPYGTPPQPQNPITYPQAAAPAPPAVPVAPVAQPTAPPRTAVINPTSSGVLLNGKPLDDSGKKKR